MRKFVIAFAVASLAPVLHAQQPGKKTPGDVAFFSRVTVEPDLVKGAPYSAEVVNESVQTLSDGNRIVRRTTARVYRDSEGRTRREEDRVLGGSPGVSISDPVAGLTWTLEVDARTARQSPFAPRIYSGALNRNGELESLTVLLNGQLASFVARGGNGGFIGSNEQSVEEKLTPKTIEGLRVEGVRRTMTIPAGTIGNERPIVVMSEQWTSPELKALVLSESNDPRTGTSTYKLVNVKRGDPPATLFQVPADYTVVQAPGRGGARGGRQ